MNISTVKYFVFDAGKSIKRNKTLSIASIATVAAALFIFGVFILGILTINNGLDQVGSELQSKITLHDNITQEEQANLKKTLESIDGVEKVEYEDKATALKNTKEMLGDGADELLKGFDENNPMPASFIVTVKEPKYITDVTEKVKGAPGVENVKDVREVANTLDKIMNTVKIVGMAMFLVLFAVSLFLIGNTIKLAVFSRRREIGIMKFVGATDWFIRWPFIIEGMIIGMIGSLVSVVFLFFLYKVAYIKLAAGFTMIQLIHPTYILSTMLWEFLIAGIAIGALGSILSIRKFLKV